MPTAPEFETAHATCPVCGRDVALKEGVYRKHPSADFKTSCVNSFQNPPTEVEPAP